MTTATAHDGTSLAYTDHAGPADSEAPAVVLVHGITENSQSWGSLTARLAEQHRVIAVDLRGHGQSGTGPSYDLETMATDVVSVLTDLDCGPAHLVGHSLGGAVVSAVGAMHDVASIVNVDQSLRLGGFKEGLTPVEPMLRDAASFPAVMQAVFADLAGPKISPEETARLQNLRRPEQDVVLGVWDVIFSHTAPEIDAVIETSLSGYQSRPAPYLSLFGIDPGPDYADWLGAHIATATVELWDDHGHYPHLVDPDRFLTRLESFWG